VLCDVRPGHVRCVLFVPYINGNQFAAPLFTMTQQPQWAGRASSLSRIRDHTELDTPQSVGLLWTSDQPDAQTSTSQHTTLTTDRHPWPRRDSNPQSQQASALDRRLRPNSRHQTNKMHLQICITVSHWTLLHV